MKKISRRNFVKLAGLAVTGLAFGSACGMSAQAENSRSDSKMSGKITAGTGGDKYIPYAERTGAESVVYFTRDLSAAGLIKIYDKISSVLSGKIAVKLHTGEPHGPNIIPRPWVKELFAKKIPNATIIETNTYYGGARYTTDQHRKTLEVNGWTFSPVDITDADGTVTLPVPGGKWFKEMSVGKSMLNYDSFLTLTHFKGHAMGGFGGSNKNIGIGCADGRTLLRKNLWRKSPSRRRLPFRISREKSLTSTLCAT